MRVYLGFVGVLASIFVVDMVWVFAADPGAFWPSIKAIFADPWGLLTMFDLTLGVFLFSGIIYANETNKSRALLWIAFLWCTGNPASAIYVLCNYRSIWERLNPKEEDAELAYA